MGMVVTFEASNPRCSLATHLPRWRPQCAGYIRAALAHSSGDVLGLRGGFRVLVCFVMVLLMVWFPAATRRGAGVFGDLCGGPLLAAG